MENIPEGVSLYSCSPHYDCDTEERRFFIALERGSFIDPDTMMDCLTGDLSDEVEEFGKLFGVGADDFGIYAVLHIC